MLANRASCLLHFFRSSSLFLFCSHLIVGEESPIIFRTGIVVDTRSIGNIGNGYDRHIVFTNSHETKPASAASRSSPIQHPSAKVKQATVYHEAAHQTYKKEPAQAQTLTQETPTTYSPIRIPTSHTSPARQAVETYWRCSEGGYSRRAQTPRLRSRICRLGRVGRASIKYSAFVLSDLI